MSSQRVLITGGFGCIGSETAKWLIRNTDASVILCSRTISQSRMDRVFHDVDQSRLKAVAVDVQRQSEILQVLKAESINRVAHLAALQTPDCNANRDLGLQINLAGTQNVIEAMKQLDSRMDRFVFASSIAVYGPRAFYPTGIVPMDAAPKPVNVYGVWKLASEQICQFFQTDTSVPTVCLRPGVLFGPGRDAGLTSSPTTAMKCVAMGLPYEITFKTQQDYLYAPDAGAAFGHSLMDSFNSYGVYTMPHHTIDSFQFASMLKQASISLEIDQRYHITVGTGEAPFICELDYEPFRCVFPSVPNTPIETAIRDSLAVFINQAKLGWLTRTDVNLNK